MSCLKGLEETYPVVEVSFDGLLDPVRVVEVGMSLLLGVTGCRVGHLLEVVRLAGQPTGDEGLRVLAELQVELAVHLHLVDLLHEVENLERNEGRKVDCN